MLVMAQALRLASWQAGLLGGLSAAALLAVSIEGLPVVAPFAGLAALRWALAARGEDRAPLCGSVGGIAGRAIRFQFIPRTSAALLRTCRGSPPATHLAACVPPVARAF